MKRSYHDFFGKLLLEVRGEGGRSTGQFRTMYDHYEVKDPSREPDMVVEQTTEDIEVETVLGDPDDHYGWTGDRFVVRNRSSYMAVEPGWSHIYVTPNWEPFYAIYPVEFRVRRQFVDEDSALVHASGIELDGETTLFPAWRGAGKTNTLISLLREGAGFLADDRLWVGADGSVKGYPLSVNLQPYNIQSFPEIQIQHDGLKDHARQELSEYIDQNFDVSGSVFEKGVTFFNRYYLKDNSRTFTDVSTLFPQAEYVEDSSVDNVVILRAAPKADDVEIEEVSDDDAVSATQAISFYEWNERLEEYFRAYDALVPGGSAVDELERVIDAEERVFERLFEDVDTYRASIPRKADWGADGIDEQVVDAVRSLGRRKRIEADD
jgi:hypothetical protein